MTGEESSKQQAASPERKELARCRHHASERWVVCVHTDKIELARPIRTWIRGFSGGAGVTWQVDGEALCPGCFSAISNGRPPSRDLRLACGACVRARWPVEGAS